jgi:putative aldouronate transport system substrate-binding protein
MKRVMSFVILVMLILTLIPACTSTDEKNGTTTSEPKTTTTTSTASTASTAPTTTQTGKTAEPVTLTMMVQNHASNPFKEDWLIWKLHEINANVKLKVSGYVGNWWDAIPLIIASRDLPDLMWMVSTDSIKYGQEGALLDYFEYVDQMPNLEAFIEKYPSQVTPLLSTDNKLYLHPSEGSYGKFSGQMLLYREDIFKKHNIPLPKNYDEFYEVLLELKRLYPESTPLYFSGTNSFAQFGLSFGTNSTFFYDSLTKTVKYGPMEPGMKELLEFVARAYQDKLIPAEFGNLNTQKRNELLSTGKTFLLFTYYNNIDSLNSTMREANPDFTLAFMPPPEGLPGMRYCDFELFLGEGLTVASTSKNKEAALTYVDYLFSEKGVETCSWGEEGTTYRVVSGKKQFIPEVTDISYASNEYGLFTSGNMAYIDFSAKESLMSEAVKQAYNQALDYILPISVMPPLTSEENDEIAIATQSIDKFMNEQISKMVIGNLPMSNWDAYIAGLKNLGIDKVLEVYNNAEARRQKAME